MKYLDEFSNPDLAHKLLDQIHAVTTQSWAMMEVCGGQTHSIIRHGIDQLLPEGLEMIHGPGCPVCVTPLEIIDKALAIAALDNVIFCSFGDMLRVPGSGPRPQCDGHGPVPASGREVQGPDRGHRLRAAGHPRGDPPDRRPARGGPARARERLPAGGAGRG